MKPVQYMLGLALLCSSCLIAQPSSLDALLDLSLQELSDIQVTSVSRRAQSLSRAAASIFVITADDIRRSGATTIPEILRLAPNLQVARVDSVQYAITARGFNNTVGNKLLVLMDGRTLYTPLFSGVFWEMQDTLLQDIDRIEVISGPGATLWGANAVNGVINIISKPASETGAIMVSGEFGDREQGFAARTGGPISDQWHWRAYMKARKWDNTGNEASAPQTDNWRKQQVGFRLDRTTGDSDLTIQGDAYTGESQHRGFAGTLEIPEIDVSGMNLIARWEQRFANDSDVRVQAYWSYSKREEFVLFSPEANIVDLEFQHRLNRDKHQLVWGGGYRNGRDDVDAGVFTAILPAKRSQAWKNVFIQDQLRVSEQISATAGIKLEWNDYTGMEYLPSLRLGWVFAENQFIWAAASRAVRAPSRFDRDVFLPTEPPYIIAGGPDFVAEVAEVYEIGYRASPNDRFNISVTLFHHDWDKLRSGTQPPFPTFLSNGIEGETYGVEAWMTWQALSFWRVSGGFTTLEKNLAFSPGNGDTAGTNNATLHNDPDYQWQVRSSIEMPRNISLDLFLRHVAELTVEPVPDYTELNARLAWRPLDRVEVHITARELLDNDHPEFGAFTNRSRIDRSILLGFNWSY